MTLTPHHPEVNVRLVGENGNAFSILARVGTALRKAGVSPEEVARYNDEAMSGDYDNLLAVTIAWVSVS